MFLHLGGDVVVPTREIVAVIDVSMAASSPAVLRMLEAARRAKGYRELHGGRIKALVVTPNGTYGSPISPGTLRRRAVDYLHAESQPERER